MSLNRNLRADEISARDKAAGVRTSFPVSSSEIDATMLAVITACLIDKKRIEVSDFTRALVPKEEIVARFPRLLAQAKANLRFCGGFDPEQ